MGATDRQQLPAYGSQLLAAQRAGKNVPWLLIAMDWGLGRALPRVVVTPEIHLDRLDLSMAKGLDCMVAHRSDTAAALDVAHIALRYGAITCPVFDRDLGKLTHTTQDVLAVKGAW